MPKTYSDLIANIHGHTFFQDFKRDLLKQRPIIPSFNPKEDNTEEWKANSMMQQGFDLALVFLKIPKE